IDIVDVDAKMMQPRHVAGLPADDRHADITVTDADGVIGANRFLFFFRPWLRPFHTKGRFKKPRLAHEVFTDDSGVLDLGEHKPPCGRLFQWFQSFQQFQSLVACYMVPTFETVGTAGTIGTGITSQ